MISKNENSESRTLREEGLQIRENAKEAAAPAVFLWGPPNLGWHPSPEIFPGTREK